MNVQENGSYAGYGLDIKKAHHEMLFVMTVVSLKGSMHSNGR